MKAPTIAIQFHLPVASFWSTSEKALNPPIYSLFSTIVILIFIFNFHLSEYCKEIFITDLLNRINCSVSDMTSLIWVGVCFFSSDFWLIWQKGTNSSQSSKVTTSATEFEYVFFYFSKDINADIYSQQKTLKRMEIYSEMNRKSAIV